jgi:hypothetical protein
MATGTVQVRAPEPKRVNGATLMYYFALVVAFLAVFSCLELGGKYPRAAFRIPFLSSTGAFTVMCPGIASAAQVRQG